MNISYPIEQLSLNKGVFEQLFKVKDKDAALWKPNPDHWCLLQIVCHLVDEETDDFRTRVKTALNPELPFVPIDPVGWVTARNYMAQDYDTQCAEWLAEREKSLQWLRTLHKADWQSELQHPEMGPISAYRFLANWVAHDHIHIRQILKVKQAYLAYTTGQDLSYAGIW